MIINENSRSLNLVKQAASYTPQKGSISIYRIGLAIIMALGWLSKVAAEGTQEITPPNFHEQAINFSNRYPSWIGTVRINNTTNGNVSEVYWTPGFFGGFPSKLEENCKEANGLYIEELKLKNNGKYSLTFTPKLKGCRFPPIPLTKEESLKARFPIVIAVMINMIVMFIAYRRNRNEALPNTPEPAHLEVQGQIPTKNKTFTPKPQNPAELDPTSLEIKERSMGSKALIKKRKNNYWLRGFRKTVQYIFVSKKTSASLTAANLAKLQDQIRNSRSKIKSHP